MIDYPYYKYGEYLNGNLKDGYYEIFEMVINLNQFLQCFQSSLFMENDIEEKLNNENISIICGAKMYYRECMVYIVCKYYDYLKSSIMNKNIFDSLINELEACIMNRDIVGDEIKDYLGTKVCLCKYNIYNKYRKYTHNWPYTIYDLIEHKLI